MDKIEKQTLIEMSLYILEATGGVDVYRLFKTLYFAHRRHLATYGIPLVADEFHALKFGPVPTCLYDFYKYRDNDFCEVVEVGDQNALRGKRSADRDYLAKADIESLDIAISDCRGRSFKAILDRTHDKYWEKAFKSPSSSKLIPRLDIARSAGASDEMLEYIASNLAIEEALL